MAKQTGLVTHMRQFFKKVGKVNFTRYDLYHQLQKSFLERNEEFDFDVRQIASSLQTLARTGEVYRTTIVDPDEPKEMVWANYLPENGVKSKQGRKTTVKRESSDLQDVLGAVSELQRFAKSREQIRRSLIIIETQLGRIRDVTENRESK